MPEPVDWDSSFRQRLRLHYSMQSAAAVEDELDVCPICLSEPENITTIYCGHVFCFAYIATSVRYSQNCPICRSLIVPNTIDSPPPLADIWQQWLQSPWSRTDVARQWQRTPWSRTIPFHRQLGVTFE